jgi:2-polyprenyl-3-methyl-5-hydroxy-6-metoxy-1,4-benzoquinol methylase
MSNEFDNYLTQHFDHVGGANRSVWRAESLRANYLQLFRGLKQDAAVLEIGPGNGELLGIMRDEAGLTRASAIDLSPEVVKHCNERFGGITLLVDDSKAFLDRSVASFDVIILLHVLEHVPKPETLAFLRAIHGALRPGGQVVIEVPNMANPLVGLTSRYADFTHEVGFTEASLSQVLRMASFPDISVRPFRIPRTSFARWVQWFLRWVVEKSFWLLAKLYSAQPEINSANLVAVARKRE